jgi:hypothetical protein
LTLIDGVRDEIKTGCSIIWQETGLLSGLAQRLGAVGIETFACGEITPIP